MADFTDDVITSKKFVTGNENYHGKISFKTRTPFGEFPIHGDKWISIKNDQNTLKFLCEYVYDVLKIDSHDSHKTDVESNVSAPIDAEDFVIDPFTSRYEFRTIMEIDSKENKLLLRSEDDNPKIILSGKDCTIILKNKDSNDCITIDGENGDICLVNGSCAEDFVISEGERADPGTVMAMNDDGKLVMTRKPYDKRVVGVVSGAGDLKPGIVFGRKSGNNNRVPIALVGRVNCKVDASRRPIYVGDLLTTSYREGHAMSVIDPERTVGAVIGKALRSLESGRGLIPILVALQ